MKRMIAFSACTLLVGACATTESDGPSATAAVRPASGSQVHGTVTFTQVGSRVRVVGEIAALTPGAHGFHVHEKGDCSSPDAESAGGHFNPQGKKHGPAHSADRHAGDLGNLTANEYGRANVSIMVDGLSVGKGADSVVGKAIVVHANADDLKTDPSGNSGARVGCGVIQ